jgi:hypothetical protein
MLPRSTAVVMMIAAALAATGGISPAGAQGRQDPGSLIAAQKNALASLAFMDGVWRGPAWTMLPSGEKHNITQTERIGPFLDGSVKVIEGRGYDADGSVSFNALGIVSFSPETGAYSMHSHAMGRSGDFVLTPRADGFVWEIPAGPMTIRYTATVKDGKWQEVGDRVMPGQEPVRFFEMNLVRVGDTDWPGAGAIAPK